MPEPLESPYLVPFDGSFRVDAAATAPPDDAPGAKRAKRGRKELIGRLDDLQRRLYAHDRFAVLLVFQALDAAGKDSTIRAVMRGVNPAGCEVSSFKQPSAEELDHDFLWRTSLRLPQRGRIGIFNRSYYEEVLVVRVHPEYLGAQKLPQPLDVDRLWTQRFEAIREHERHLAEAGTVILKFWLNVSADEQKRRFLDRIDTPEKNWKFSTGDVRERAFFDQYLHAYEAALNATSRPWAPWYAIPADSKPFMRLCVAEIIVGTLARLGLAYPQVGPEKRQELAEMRHLLEQPPS
ncbi:MAG: PPK2 family polyphosphate kinase [Planctomycetota bacterium]|jgi:PPK2 family polyphosphate:nucleotide phosphotransferase